MNKLLVITSSLLTVGGLWGSSEESASTILSDLNIDAKVEFNTARVSEGRRLADQHFFPSLEISAPVFDAGGLYFGLDSFLKLNSSKGNVNELAPYLGCFYDVTDILTVDFGYTLRRGLKSSSVKKVGGKAFKLVKEETDDDKNINTISKKRTYHEIYLGLMIDAPVNPQLYFTYDFTQKKANLEGRISHTFDLGTFGANGFAINLGAKVGYSRANRPYGISRTTPVTFANLNSEENEKNNEGEEQELNFGDATNNLFEKKDWFYVGLNADLVYSLNDNTKARAGIAFSHNNAAKDSWINDVNSKKYSVWFSSAIELSF
ncbi:MAG: hypothetical protein LBI77_00805 [Puniceicoccales bacterium]|jgi:hypothetical protein|nr:hypothetical protein [Puniceicoccales bacterium]